MAKIRVNDIDFYYECHGKGDPIVLIAGYSCDHTFWANIIDELTLHYQVYIFDNRGMGQTKDSTVELTLELMADDVIQIIKSLNIKQPIILGHSMGGIIAQIVAHKHPKGIKKLIVLNSAATINARTLMVLDSLLKVFKENVSFDTLISANMPWFFSPDYLANPKNIAWYKEFCKNNPFPPRTRILERQLAALVQHNSENWLSELRVPTLVIASENDIICLPAESKRLANNIPNAEFRMISGGHASPVEDPHQVILALANISF